MSFSKLARVKRGETVIFSWIGYRSRAHRDAVNARVMKDPRIAKMMTEASPFDPSRMAYSGFKMIVDGECDALPEQAFYMIGTIDEAFEKAKAMGVSA